MDHFGFDAAAISYDRIFTSSAIGRYQRREVWRYLDKIIHKNQLKYALDLGCGTGEDAAYLLRKGLRVHAIDPSPVMIEKTREKVGSFIQDPSRFLSTCDSIESWTASTNDDMKYDLVFSNFGALNLVSPDALHATIQKLDQNLKKGAHVIFVILPTFCLWESAYFLYKGNWKRILQRKSSPVLARIEGADIPTWYYDTRDLCKSIESLKLIFKKPIGLFIPPSYLSPTFEDKKKMLKLLLHMEQIIGKWPFTCRMADHFLIHFEK